MSGASMTPYRIVHGDTTLDGFVHAPTRPGPHAAVLLFPGATGPGPTFRKTVQELGERGYLAIGADMYGLGADLGTPQAAGAYFEKLLNDPELLRARVVAWFDAVSGRDDVDAARVAAIGYCFGGKCVLELARSGAPVACVTSYHGLLKTHAPAQPGVVKAKVAVWSGGEDPYAPIADFDAVRAEFDAAQVDYQATLFAKAEHSFTDPDHDGLLPGIAYDRLAHQVSWAGTLALLEACLQN
ncbi:dienelactone hydrolase [Novosphingobium chloroacetimidivorans]|uniref:Dienelactone hydrolase n=1 Tax=Novosphingobium chloroacetimidivorans TaxID=1428314 RepID=A0A7W7KCB9_9SPHN|nr:dienelactone hydrolase family protein [Novosphingobium chloroacetimidivorans]MBB4860217.1 dienelactone hydrolase [Novosphingobium chloroacetimidivorans]